MDIVTMWLALVWAILISVRLYFVEKRITKDEKATIDFLNNLAKVVDRIQKRVAKKEDVDDGK